MSELVNFIISHEEAFKSKARLTSLYSDFSRLKTANPDGYTANVAAWTSALTRASKAGLLHDNECGPGLLSFKTGVTLEGKLECSGVGRPVSLGAAVDEAVVQRDLIPLHDFLSAKTSILQGKSWKQFQLPTAWQVALWGLRQVGLAGSSSGKLADAEYVVVANLEATAQKFLSRLSAHPPPTASSRVHSLETFTHEYASLISPSSDHTLTASDLRLLLTYLSRDKNLITLSTPASAPAQTTIKLPPSPTTTAEPVTQHDHTIAQLRTLQESLTTQTSQLTTRIESLEQTARAAISSRPSKDPSPTEAAAPNTLPSQNKSRALSALRQKVLASATLTKRLASLAQIDRTLSSIDDAVSQAELVSAMQSSATVLRDLNKQIGGVEGVAAVMDAVEEGVLDVEDVGKAITEVNLGAVDEGEVDDEFEALQAEARKREEESKLERKREGEGESKATQDLETKLPDVPTGEVGETSKQSAKTSGGEEGEGKTARSESELAKRLSLLSVEEDEATSPSIAAKFAESAEAGNG